MTPSLTTGRTAWRSRIRARTHQFCSAGRPGTGSVFGEVVEASWPRAAACSWSSARVRAAGEGKPVADGAADALLAGGDLLPAVQRAPRQVEALGQRRNLAVAGGHGPLPLVVRQVGDPGQLV